ncbi:MAG: peptide chain release factor N(5)-glutamine methyltransferase [Thermoanaerobacteraceae bacterium]|nr:peptide chain release factor N(5)-glutamine methyltransferase [Thermoanaerobacteraceae bacterium]
MKVYEAVLAGAEMLKSVCENPRFESELFLAFTLDTDRRYIIINRDTDLKEEDLKHFFGLISERKKNIPYQYIVGKKYFMGLEFEVSPAVLIPRPETEILVEEVLKRLKPNSRFLDIGTGSGAIAVSIAKYSINSKGYAVDISNDALAIAKKNAKRNAVDGKIKFIKSDLYSSLPDEAEFDFIISNPPYIRSKDIEKLQEEVQKEPLIALDGGKDGLLFYRRIIKDAGKYLKADGYIAFEVGYNQAGEVKDLLKNANFFNLEVIKDLQGIDRVVIGKRGLFS